MIIAAAAATWNMQGLKWKEISASLAIVRASVADLTLCINVHCVSKKREPFLFLS